jgi:ribonuclease Z
MSERLRDAYFPGTEELGEQEMRITALGTGMPNLRPSQASASFFVELGNGDKFFFDMGTGCIMNFCGLGVSYVKANKLFLSHLHTDHMAHRPHGRFHGLVCWRLDRKAG